MSMPQWTSTHYSILIVILAVYLYFVLAMPGRIVYRHKWMPHWYRFQGILSLLMVILLSPEIMHSLSHGWYHTVCDRGQLFNGFLSGSMMCLFLVSKLFDLVETILIILDTRKPLAIHIFHHFCTVVFVWICFSKQTSLLRVIAFANAFSHTLLFSYLTPLKFGIRPCYTSVALSQMAQFIVSIYVCYSARSYLDDGRECTVDSGWLQITQLGLLSFLFLFADFYHQKYVKFREQRSCTGEHGEAARIVQRRTELRSEIEFINEDDRYSVKTTLTKRRFCPTNQ